MIYSSISSSLSISFSLFPLLNIIFLISRYVGEWQLSKKLKVKIESLKLKFTILICQCIAITMLSCFTLKFKYRLVHEHKLQCYENIFISWVCTSCINTDIGKDSKKNYETLTSEVIAMINFLSPSLQPACHTCSQRATSKISNSNNFSSPLLAFTVIAVVRSTELQRLRIHMHMKHECMRNYYTVSQQKHNITTKIYT